MIFATIDIEFGTPGDVQLILPCPPSVNGAYRNLARGGRCKTKGYGEWIKLAESKLKQYEDAGFLNLRKEMAFLKHKKIKPPHNYILGYEFSFKDSRARDGENYLKCLTDFLVSHNIIYDDSLVVAQFWHKLPPGKNNVEICIKYVDT